MRPAGELRTLLLLAVPLVLGHAGSQLMSLVDTAMVGRLGAAALGGSGIAGALWFCVSCLGLGLVLGAETLMAQAVGAGERATARRAFYQALWVAVLVGPPLTLCCLALPLVFPLAGVEAATAAEATRGLYGRLPQILPFLLFAACRSSLQSRSITRPIVVAVIVSNVLNVLLNWILIYGDAGLLRLHLPPIGLPALGVLGSGLSTSLSQIGALGVVAVALRVSFAEERLAPAQVRLLRRRDPVQLRRIVSLGAPIALQILAEIGAFALAALLAGRLGAQASAGHQVAITLASFTFTVTLGVGSAAAVRVGHHIGAGAQKAARRAGFLAILVSCGFMSLSALTFLLCPLPLAAFFTGDPQIAAAAVPLLLIAAAFQLFDGAQVAAAGALRGAGDTRVPFLANLLGYYAVGIPVSIVLGFHLGLGARGIWWGLTLGLLVVSLWLVLRFAWLSARPMMRA